jgi:hypothetical protein
MSSARHHPRVLACPGLDGVAWVIGCDRSRECVVVDAHHAHDTVSSVVAEGGLTVVASLGTAQVPERSEAERSYARLLADLGLVPEVAPFVAGVAIGPTAGWGGALVARVGERIVELGDVAGAAQAHGALVYTDGTVVTDPMQLTVSALLVRFGRLCAVGAPHPAAPDGTLSWRIQDHLFVQRRGMIEPLDLEVHATDSWSPDEQSPVWGGHEVRVIDPHDLDLVSDLQILDVAEVDDLDLRIVGARRVGAAWKSAELALDPWRYVMVVSPDGTTCSEPAARLAEAGFRVLRLRGGTAAGRAGGLPVERPLAYVPEDLSLDGLTGPSDALPVGVE